MIYPYTGRDFFAEPELYEYAKCDSADYLKDWENSRTAAKLAFSRRADEWTDATRTRAIPCVPPDAISLHNLLQQQLVDRVVWTPSSSPGAELEPLIVKFEVFGRLFAWYQHHGLRHPESPHADLGTYILFAQRLYEIAESRESLKHLSTLIKLCDALASQPTHLFEPQEARKIVDILSRERLLVQIIAKGG